jgi:hypothetical protein
MDRRRSRQIRIVCAARLGLAVLLLIGLFSNLAPLAPVSAGSMCTLECCAGRAPHAAGSCMDGTCQAVLSTHKTRTAHRVTQAQDDKLCGLNHAVATNIVGRASVDRAPRPAKSDPATISAAAFVKACQPDCGGCASGFASSNRQRNAATMAHAVRRRPPTDLRLPGFARHGAQTLDALCREGAPRGPPVSFS